MGTSWLPAIGGSFTAAVLWHETLGKLTKEVTVRSNEDSAIATEMRKE